MENSSDCNGESNPSQSDREALEIEQAAQTLLSMSKVPMVERAISPVFRRHFKPVTASATTVCARWHHQYQPQRPHPQAGV